MARTTILYNDIWLAEAGALQAALERLDAMDLAALAREGRGEREGREAPYTVQNGTAVLKLHGPMTRDEHCLQDLFGGVSTVKMRRDLRAAVRDPDVKSILLDVDSPGGEVAGTAELAQEVARATKYKPVVSQITGMAASAAMWVASQADAVYAETATNMAGSLGVYTTISDTSKAYEAKGVTRHLVRDGEFKGVGEPGIPVGKKELEHLQKRVRAIGGHFRQAVAAGRNLTADQADALFTGETWLADEAMERGLIDGISSSEDTLARLATGERPAKTLAASPAASAAEPQEENRMDPKEQAGENALMAKIAAWFGLKPKVEEPEPEEAQIEPEPVVAETSPLLAALEARGIESVEALEEVLAWADTFRTTLTQLYATEYCRVFGAGKLSVEDAETRLKGRDVAGIRAEIATMAEKADAQFTHPGGGEGRATEPPADPDADAAAAEAKARAEREESYRNGLRMEDFYAPL